MNSSIRRWTKLALFIVLSLTLVVALLSSACGGAKPAAQVQKVKVGLSLGFTGAFASGTGPLSNGVLAYMKYVNDQGGVQYTDPTTGKTEKALLDIDWQDDAYDVGKVLSIYETQKTWGATSEVLVMSPDVLAGVASRDGVPVLSAGNLGGPSLSEKPIYVTALYPAYIDQVIAFMQWAKTQQATPPRIAWLALDTPAFQSAAGGAGMTNALAQQYGCVFVDRETVEATASDMTIQLTRIKEANPDWIIVQAIPNIISLAQKDAQLIGMPASMKFVAITTFSEELIPLIGNATWYGTTSWAFGTENSIAGVQFVHQIMNKYYGLPGDTQNAWGVLLAMIEVGAIQKALDTVGYTNLTPAAMNDALHSLTNFDTMGLTAPITTTPDYPVCSQSLKVGVIQGGKLTGLSDFIPMGRVGLTMPD